jgi:hypothetical protein
LSKQQREIFKKLFRARRLEVKLVPTSPPEFPEHVVADPAATAAIPSRASVRSEWTQIIDSGSGDAQSVQQNVTVELHRTAKGWIIVRVIPEG